MSAWAISGVGQRIEEITVTTIVARRKGNSPSVQICRQFPGGRSTSASAVADRSEGCWSRTHTRTQQKRETNNEDGVRQPQQWPSVRPTTRAERVPVVVADDLNVGKEGVEVGHRTCIRLLIFHALLERLEVVLLEVVSGRVGVGMEVRSGGSRARRGVGRSVQRNSGAHLNHYVQVFYIVLFRFFDLTSDVGPVGGVLLCTREGDER